MSQLNLTTDLTHDRFTRLRSITWWDQAKLSKTKALVIGAGALGNEIVKNLALVGVGQVVIIDRDTIELSNLSRSILFREADLGKKKSDIAAEFARQIYPQIQALSLPHNLLADIGAGVFRWADVIIAGLDNREARLHINRRAWKLGKPWIDGAIEQIQGLVRIFSPDLEQQSPCYECTLTERDWQLLAQRRSCALLSREQMQTGHTPTTPTIASIVAGVQVQEALKQIHGIESFASRCWQFQGLTSESFFVDYQRNPDCASHERFDDVIELQTTSDELTIGELLNHARELLGKDATLDLGIDIVTDFVCSCGRSEKLFRPLASLTETDARCTCADRKSREAKIVHQISGDEPFLNRSLKALGLPPFDIIAARQGERLIGFEISGDASTVLGELAGGGLQWK
ncbi:MAG TPA: ThiF family adenylyltransferase [Tepidisphaeraceae bacterium]|nr:ThiF family adenylyltransferase [Tepidisphaeraceae bacterium]